MNAVPGDAELYVLLRKAGEDREAAQALIDRHRAEVLREAADVVDPNDDCDCGGCDTCVPRKLADQLRRMADEATS